MATRGIVVYCIANGARTYVGYTVDFAQRLRKHRGEIAGGADSTGAVASRAAWTPVFVVRGFATQRHARQLEWLLHRRHARRKDESTREWRLRRLREAMAQERFTKEAPVTAACGLETQFY